MGSPVGQGSPPQVKPQQRRRLSKRRKQQCPSRAASWRNEQYPSSRAHLSNQPVVVNDKQVLPPSGPDMHMPVGTSFHDTASNVERRTNVDILAIEEGHEGLEAPSQSLSSDWTMVNAEDEEWNASCMSHHRPQSAKTRRFTSLISNGFFCYNRRAHEVDEQIAGPSATERTVPSSIRNEHSHSRREGEQVSTTELDADNNGWKSVDTVVAGQTSTGPTEIERLQRDLSVALSRIAELQKRYEAQSKDLEVSNSFFNIADKSSDSDIIRALQRLNAEVQQNATYMADSLVQDFEFKSMATDTTEKWTSLVRRVSGHIGLVLANALRSSPQEVLLFLQIALQVHLVTVLGRIASAWALDAGHNSFIDGIYQTLRGVEAQATAGRWRALARLYNFHDGVSHPESVVKRVITDISDIVLVAGCTASRSDIIGTITSKFEDRLTLLVTLAGHLNKSFNEVISSDFEVFLARPGDAFQSKNMEESDEGQARGQERSVVLCTTHLGLLKQVPVGTLWEKGKKQEVMVLKAKVLPESFLDTENT